MRPENKMTSQIERFTWRRTYEVMLGFLDMTHDISWVWNRCNFTFSMSTSLEGGVQEKEQTGRYGQLTHLRKLEKLLLISTILTRGTSAVAMKSQDCLASLFGFVHDVVYT